MLKAQLARSDDMIGRLLAAKALADRKTKASAELLHAALTSDAFFGVRLAAAESLAANGSDESFELLASAWRGQTDARVRKAVVEQVAKRYHPTARRVVDEVLAEEHNPEIVAVATRALARFGDDAAEQALREQLRANSFRDELLIAAIAAIESRQDPALVPALVDLLNDRGGALATRGLAQGLRSVGALASEADDQTAVRELLMRWLHDPRSGVQTAALQGLGALGNRRALAAIEGLQTAPHPGVAAAAKAAVNALNEKQALDAPAEVIALRKELGELKDNNKKLSDEIAAIQKQLESLVSPPEKDEAAAD